MKNLYSCIFIFSLFFAFISCTDDSSILSDSGIVKDVAVINSKRVVGQPANAANPYDAAGRLHNEILEGYYNIVSLPTTPTGILNRIELVANANSEFVALSAYSYQSPPITLVENLYANQQMSTSGQAPNVISASGTSSLATFRTGVLLLYANYDYDVIYNYITNYETSVAVNPGLSQNDKRVILTTTSISRFSMFRRKKPKRNLDPDWDWMTASIMASSEGAGHDLASAITYSLYAGLRENQY